MLTIHQFTVILAKQDLNTGPTAKTRLFFYTKIEPVLADLTEDQLSHIYSESQAIQTKIANEVLRRARNADSIRSDTPAP